MRFHDRTDAGRQLGRVLRRTAALTSPVVVGLPRGGVPVAAEVARALGAPLDVVVVRKLGAPRQPELALGAVGESGVRLVDDALVRACGVTAEELAGVERREAETVERQVATWRGERPPVPLAGHTVVVVDDGVATGATARAACRVVRARGAGRVVLAVPVGPAGVERRLRPDADAVLCLLTPEPFTSVGAAYADFRQTTDAQVAALLRPAAGAG